MKRYRSAEEQVRIYLFTYLFIYLFIYFWWSIFRRSDQNCWGKKEVLPGHFVYVPEVFSSVKTNKFRRKQIVLNWVNFYIFLKYFSGEFLFFQFFIFIFVMRKSEWKKKIQLISFLVRECVFSFLEGSNVCFLWYSFYTTGWNSPLPRGKKFFVFFFKTTERDTDNNLVRQKNSTIAFVQIAKWSIWCKCVTGHKKMWLLNDFSFFTWSNTKKKSCC